MSQSDPWTAVWQASSAENLRASLDLERHGQRWRICRQILERQHGDLSNLRAIELGAGVGMFSYLLAEAGSSITLLDTCTEALDRAKTLHASHANRLTILRNDALAYTPDTPYDLAVSLGLIEHFSGEQQTDIVSAHRRMLRKGGTAIISVPNHACGLYRRNKERCERNGTWEFGQEFPFTRDQLMAVCRKAGFCQVRIFGSPYLEELDRYLLHKGITRIFGTAQLRLPPIDDRYGGCLFAIADA